MSDTTDDAGDRDAAAVRLLREALPDLVAAYRFGSSVGEAEHRESDLDFAFLAERGLDPLARFDLQERIASAVRRSVDLVDLRAASTVMAMQVVSTGRLIFQSDPARRGRFEDLTYARYARLNEERRGILERIAHEGTVHGR